MRLCAPTAGSGAVKIRLFLVAMALGAFFPSVKEWDVQMIVFRYQRGVVSYLSASKKRANGAARRPTVHRFLNDTKPPEFAGAH